MQSVSKHCGRPSVLFEGATAFLFWPGSNRQFPVVKSCRALLWSKSTDLGMHVLFVIEAR